MTTLVSYASRHGATEGIARRISERIAASGERVDLQKVDAVGSLDGYDMVVFGAPVYHQSWPPEADQFVAAHRDALATRPLWLFSVGSFGDTKRVLGALTHKEPKNIAQMLATLHPRDYRVFQGVIQKQQWPFWSRLLYHALGGRLGDHRDWQAIDAWGKESRRRYPLHGRPARPDPGPLGSGAIYSTAAQLPVDRTLTVGELPRPRCGIRCSGERKNRWSPKL